ncbi:hypothetical protein HanIR_Chr12g0589221 [Helianthus annuus]|nr:hypothetical protein HanIR_Chr12g0589221 [Helianthus annuus]
MEVEEGPYFSSGMVRMVFPFRHAKYGHIYAFAVRDLWEFHNYVDAGQHERDTVHDIIIIECWCIWKTRYVRNCFQIKIRRSKTSRIV